MKQDKPQFNIGDKIVIFIGLKKIPKIISITDVFHHKVYGWCYEILSGDHSLTIPEDDLVKGWKAKKLPPDEMP